MHLNNPVSFHEGMDFRTITAIYEKSIANIIYNSE
jgi:hypothetical protein